MSPVRRARDAARLHRLGRALAGLGPLVVGALVWPAAMLADAPNGGAPQDQVPIDGDGPLGALPAVLALGVAIAVIVGLAMVLARLGGPQPDPAASDPTVGRPSNRPALTRFTVPFWIVATGAGILLGRETAGWLHEGGFGAALAVVSGVFLVGVAAIGLLLVAGLAWRLRHGHGSRAIAAVVVAAALVPLGWVGGTVTGEATGAIAKDPVVLSGSGHVGVRLEPAPDGMTFTPVDTGVAECRSTDDGRVAANGSALDLGELGSATLRAGFVLASEGPGTASVQLFIDTGDLPEGAAQPMWAGAAQVTTAADGMSGTLAFSGLPLSDPAGKPSESGAPTPPAGWPATLSGTLTWSCDPWGGSTGNDGVPPPPSQGH